jgi:hypothetical protein
VFKNKIVNIKMSVIEEDNLCKKFHHNLPLRCRHLVNFEKKPENIYYLYSDDKWYKCTNVDRLPYHLTIYQLEDGTEIATCEDSYRIITAEKYEKGEIPTKEELIKEKEWRSKLVAKSEVDFNYYEKEGWIKAEIAWKKSDIIPNVWNINRRKGQMIGYYYYESKRFAPSSSYTEKYTEEFLENERRKEEEAKQIIKEIDEKYKKISMSLKSFIPKNLYVCSFEKYNVKNIVEYYLTLKIEDRLSDEEILELEKEGKITNFDRLLNKEFYKNLCSLIYKECDGCISNIEVNLEKNHDKKYHFVAEKYDSYYDIYIDYNKDITEDVLLKLCGHTVCKGSINIEKNIIEFTDFHRLNPLICLGDFTISSESFSMNMEIKCHYKGILYNYESRIFILGKNVFYPNYIESEASYLFSSMMMDQLKIKADEIELI